MKLRDPKEIKKANEEGISHIAIETDKTGRVRMRTINHEPTRTQQQFQEQHDINNIMKKYQKVGVDYNALPNPSGTYGDFTKVRTYQEAVQGALDSEAAFMQLPSSVRKRFANDPQELFDFLNDKNNREEAIRLGLIEKPSTPPTPSTTPSEPKS